MTIHSKAGKVVTIGKVVTVCAPFLAWCEALREHWTKGNVMFNGGELLLVLEVYDNGNSVSFLYNESFYDAPITILSYNFTRPI